VDIRGLARSDTVCMGRLLHHVPVSDEFTCVCHGNLSNLHHWMRLNAPPLAVTRPGSLDIVLVHCDLTPRFLLLLRKKVERLAGVGLRIQIEAHLNGVVWSPQKEYEERCDKAFRDTFDSVRAPWPVKYFVCSF
jgi:hypothetical protein